MTVVEASAIFQTNDQNAVITLVWSQGGQLSSYPKVILPARLTLQRQNGETQLAFTGDTSVKYILEASKDLIHWQSISTNTIWQTPVVDPEAETLDQRFYRLRMN
jgi:hypothetical protein